MRKSVYNFVPAPEENEVFIPNRDGENEVSHDIPFEDGESGEIEIKITAQTPIFIRNGHGKDVEENEFSHFKKENDEKEYFIPATSLKGMIRNTLEVFSFSRLNPELVDNNRYSYRDLKRGSQYLKNYDTNNVKAGWLEELNNEWTITECEDLQHIHHEEVDNLLQGKFKQGFQGFRKAFLNKDPIEKTAKWKYEQLKNLDSLNVEYNGIKGRLVFTGQSGKRNEKAGGRRSGKVHEFVFSVETTVVHNISKEMQKDFRFIYLEHDSNNMSADWRDWKSKLKNGEKVPVFFNKSGGKIKHFGLAFMYKLPYKKSIHELSPIKSYLEEKKRKHDLATTIFGSIKDEALKGRVYFGHALAKSAIPFSESEIKKEILANPKASYYPFYLQGGDYDNAKSKLSGFKKYPTHQSEKTGTYTEKQKKNPKVFSKFIPLKKSAEFTVKIRFHNLKKMEIGALLSALTFHNQSDLYSHTLGGAKPFGYGKVKIEVEKLNYLKSDIKEYLYDFEQTMNKHLNGNWKDQEAIWKYMAMSYTKVSDGHNRQYVYPEMNQEKRINEFTTDAKLPKYTKNEVKITSIVDEVKAEQEKKIKEAYEKIKDSNNIEKLQKFLNEFPNSSHQNKIERKIEELTKAYALEKIEEALHTDIQKIESIEELNKYIQSLKEFKEKYTEDSNINSRIYTIKERINIIANAEKLENITLVFEKTDFDSIKKVLNPIANNKAFESFDKKDKEKIIEAIRKCWETEKAKGNKNAFYKKKKLQPINSYPWTDIKKWLGEETETLYNKLTKQK